MSGNQGKGRARGRGREVPLAEKGKFAPAPAPQTTAWGPGSLAAPRPSAPIPHGGEGRALTIHRGGEAGGTSAIASTRGALVSSGGGGDNGGGNGRSEVQRGAFRGKRAIEGIIRTKPTNIVSKKGTTGREVALTTNYFKLNKKPTWNLYQYRVDFAPNIELLGLRKRLIYLQKNILGGYLFDGTMLFITNKLQLDLTEIMAKDRDDNAIKIVIKFVGLVSMTDSNSIQVLNLILRRSMDGLKLQLVGRNFFDAAAKIEIRDFNIELWPGYITSIRQHEQDILLCAEVTNKVMRTETVYDIMNKIRENTRGDFKTELLNQVLGLTVLTDYNNKTYRIDDIDFTKSPMTTFPKKDGDITFVAYYSEKYHIKIKDPRQPLLLSKAKEKDLRGNQNPLIALVPELCRATGLTDSMRQNFRCTQAMSQYTRMAPDARTRKLLEFNKRLENAKESVDNLKEWNVSLDKNLVQLSGRILNNENIVFGNNKKVLTNNMADWTREFRNISMYCQVDLKQWTVIYPKRCERETQEFVKILQQASQSMRFRIETPQYYGIQDDRSNTFTSALLEVGNKDPQLIMCVVTNNNADRYSVIKKHCCVNRPVPTQVMCMKTITPKHGKPASSLLSVGTKVAIQLNCKLGGAPWMIDFPVSGLMTIGFDVSHDTKNKSKSYGAMVATMDLKTSIKYFSAVSAHTNGEELSNEFGLNILKALKEYRATHHSLPARILIYRDGVGEGQTNYVYEHEITNIRNKLEEVYSTAGVTEGYKLAFIVVSKRINTRFFHNQVNPSPGTVVDDVVTLPERYDFFLVSQAVTQGTVSPTSYNVLFDNMGFSPDRLQILTYKMTHLYYNWSGTLRVPAVCQYAHKLAFLVGQSIHQSPNNDLEKRLYFL